MKKIALILTLALAGSLLAAPVFINSCGTLSSDTEYYLQNDLVVGSGDLTPSQVHLTGIPACFLVEDAILGPQNNIVLDCMGHSITSDGTTGFAYGIYQPYDNTTDKGYNLTIRNCTFANWTGFDLNLQYGYSAGVRMDGYENTVENSVFEENTIGVYGRKTKIVAQVHETIGNPRDFSVLNNVFSCNNQGSGVSIESGEGQFIDDNTFSKCLNGIELVCQTNSKVRCENQRGSVVSGNEIANGTNAIIEVGVGSNSTAYNYIQDNDISKPSNIGILVENSAGANQSLVSGNDVFGAVRAGLSLPLTSNYNVTNNSFRYGGYDVSPDRLEKNNYFGNLLLLNQETVFLCFYDEGNGWINRSVVSDELPAVGKFSQSIVLVDPSNYSSLCKKDSKPLILGSGQSTDSRFTPFPRIRAQVDLDSGGCSVALFDDGNSSFDGFQGPFVFPQPEFNCSPSGEIEVLVNPSFTGYFAPLMFSSFPKDSAFGERNYLVINHGFFVFNEKAYEGVFNRSAKTNVASKTENYFLGLSPGGGFLGLFKANNTGVSGWRFLRQAALLRDYPFSRNLMLNANNVSFSLWNRWQNYANFTSPEGVRLGFQWFFTDDDEFDFNCTVGNSSSLKYDFCSPLSSSSRNWVNNYLESSLRMGLKAYGNYSASPNGLVSFASDDGSGMGDLSNLSVTYSFVDAPVVSNVSFVNGDEVSNENLILLGAASVLTDVLSSKVSFITAPGDLRWSKWTVLMPTKFSYELTHRRYSFGFNFFDSLSVPLSGEIDRDPIVDPNAGVVISSSCAEVSSPLFVPSSGDCFFYQNVPLVNGLDFEERREYTVWVRGGSWHEVNFAGSPLFVSIGANPYSLSRLSVPVNFSWSLRDSLYDLNFSQYRLLAPNGSELVPWTVVPVAGNESSNSTVVDEGNFSVDGGYRFYVFTNDSRGYNLTGFISVRVGADNSPTHSECVELSSGAWQCARVAGRGQNECSSSADCGGAPVVTPQGSASPPAFPSEVPGEATAVPSEEASPLPTKKAIEQRAVPTVPMPSAGAEGISSLQAGPLDVVAGALMGLLDALMLKGICDNGVGACWVVAVLCSAFCGGLVFFSLKHELERRKGKGLRKRITWLTEKNAWYLVGIAAVFPLLPSVLIGCCEVSGYFFLDAIVCISLAIYLFLPGEEIF